MNKKMRELFAEIEAKAADMDKAIADSDLDEAEKLSAEIDELKRKYAAEKARYDTENFISDIPAPAKDPEEKSGGGDEESVVKSFADAARRGFAVKDMSEGTAADGGYTVPEDIQTMINNYRDAQATLRNYVTVVPVATNTGARTFKKKSQQTGFAKVGEKGKIGSKNTPQFERVEYSIDKYAGYFPATNELLEDSDANITSVLTEWIGEEARATDNANILTEVKTKSQTAIDGLDGIKKVLNVTLGQAYKATSKVFTNDDGLQYLDTLKDANGRYMLQPDPSNPATLKLAAGATAVEVVVVPNSDLATSGTKIPFIIGDLAEGIYLFDRRQVTIRLSDTASIGTLNAYEEDLTLFRAILREDVVIRDKDAFVYGYIDTAASAASGGTD